MASVRARLVSVTSRWDVNFCISVYLSPTVRGKEAFVVRILLNTIISHLLHLSLIEINELFFFLGKKMGT